MFTRSVRRLTFSVVMGNGDMHLKNWSLIYPGAGDTPALAPVYDNAFGRSRYSGPWSCGVSRRPACLQCPDPLEDVCPPSTATEPAMLKAVADGEAHRCPMVDAAGARSGPVARAGTHRRPCKNHDPDLARLLPVPYFHVVFTLPPEIAFQNEAVVYGF